MKLKTWPKFWPNQFYKLLILSLIIGGLGQNCFAKEDDKVPGLFSSLQDLIKIHRKQFNKQFKKLKSAKLPFPLKNAKEIRLDPFFVRSLLLYSDDKYLSLLDDNPCSLYALIDNNLLRSSEGIIKKVVTVIEAPDKKLYTVLMNKKDFLKQVFSGKCIDKKELSILYNRKNFKNTLKQVNLNNPKSYQGCLDIFRERLKNTNTPYLCKIPMTIKVGKVAERMQSKFEEQQKSISNMYAIRVLNKNFYLSNTTLFQRNYLDNLCNNLNNEEKFCAFFRADDAWSKVISGENPSYKMSFKCRNYLNTKIPLTTAMLAKCAKTFKNDPKVCVTKGNLDHPSAFPLQTCNDLSTSLNKSKLITKYHDCPGSIENQSITNIFRVMQHFEPTKEEIAFNNGCIARINLDFAKIFLESKNEDDWPLKICYQDLRKEEEICVPYIPGNGGTYELSEGNVIARVLMRNKGAPPSETCKVVDAKEYNPVKLEYRLGCFIIYNQSNCSSLNCPRKIIYKRKEVKGIRYAGKPNIDYFPNSSANISNAIVNILKADKGYRYRELRSLSEIVHFFATKNLVIAHGVGCAGDIMPESFKKRSFNECKPLPFIIDGYVKDKRKKIFLITRTAIDDVHTPRLINWNYIYSGVKNYAELHPMRSWLLYGINK